jgi:sec-independent protein translocase protein TatA
MSNFKGWEIVIVLVLLLLLFGAKRLPDAARGLGRSLRIFKAETKGLREDEEARAADGRTEPGRDATPAAPSASGAPTAPATPLELPASPPAHDPTSPRPAEHETRER